MKTNMSITVKIGQIIQQVSSLDTDSKIQVVEKIMTTLKSKKEEKTVQQNLSNLKGLGAEIWQDIDVDTFLKSEREWD